MKSGSGITSNGGSITLGGGSAGNGSGFAVGHFASSGSAQARGTGVQLFGATLDSGAGNITIRGQGDLNTTESYQYGVLIDSSNRGGGTGSRISTSGGSVTITGTGGGTGNSIANVGIQVDNNSRVEVGGAGTLTMTGTGGSSASGRYNHGFYIAGNAAVRTANGNMALMGTGGQSGSTQGENFGLQLLEGSTIESTGSGSVNMNLVGGQGGNNNDGLRVGDSGNNTIRANSGNISITATAGAGTGSEGIDSVTASNTISATSGNVTLTSDSANWGSSTSISAAAGTLTVQNRTANTLINVGGSAADVAGADGTRQLSITAAEFGRLSANNLVIGTTDSGNTTVSSALTLGNIGSNMTINSGNNLTVNGTITGDTASGPVTNDNLQLRARRDVVVKSALDLKAGDLFVQSNVNSGTQGTIDIDAALTGRHVTLENTGGTIDASTGVITRGVRRSSLGSGVTIDSNITASGNLNIFGATNASSNIRGVDITGQLRSANFSIEGDANPVGFNHNGVSGLRLRHGAQIIGTATTGNNLIRGTYNTPEYGGSNAVQLGDLGTAAVSITSAAALSINGANNYTAHLNSANVGRGISAQGTLTTSGNITWTGTSLSSDGIQSTATINHSGGALSINGTSSPASVGGGYLPYGITMGGTLTVTDGSNLSMTGTYTARGANGGTATGFVSTGLIRSTGSTPGTLNITGTATARPGATTAEVGVSVNALSGWGNTTLLAQNPAGSSQAALSTNSTINVGTNQLNVLANGGQIFQAGASSWTAGRITVDNTGAGRSSLIADTSGQSFGGSINADGSVTMGNAAVTAGSSSRGLNLNGTMAVTGDVNMATNSGAFINSQITSGGKLVARALGTLTSSRIMNASTGVEMRANGNIAFSQSITNSTSGDVVLAAGDGTTGSTATFTASDGATITQAANGNVELTTDGQGNLTPARIRKTGIGAGDIVIAAGKLLPAGTASGGQVTPLYANNNLVNSGTGNSYVYSGGTTTGTGNLSLISSSLLNLDLVGGITSGSQQNAQTNVAYNASSLGIGGSTARVQALFRGTVPLSGTLNGATVTKTYGDSSTAQTNGASLWADVVTALKAANTGNISASGTAGTFHTSRASLIDGMSAKSLTSPSYSSSNHLNANASGYTYAALDTSGGGATWTRTGPVMVVVIKASLSALSGSKTYNGQVATLVAGTSGGTLTLTGVAGETASLKTGESVAISSANAGSRAVTAAGISSLSNSKLASGATLDLNNYDLGQTVASNNVTVNRASLASISGSKTYDGQTATLVAGTSGGTLSLTGVAGETASLKAGQGVAISSADAGGRTVTDAGITSLDNSKLASGGTINLNNYDLSQGATSNSVTVAQARLTAISGSKTYDGQTATLVAGTSGGTLTLTGVAGETASLKTGEGVAISSPDAGNRTVNTSEIGSLNNSKLASGGMINLNNYDLNQGVASNNVTVNKAQLTAISGSKTYDGQNSLTVGSNGGTLTFSGVNGESASIATGTVALSGKDVATHGQSVTAITATGLSTASNTTLNLNNYDLQVVPTPGVNNANNRVDIGQASLTVTANDDAKFVTRPDAANYNGVGYSGWVGGEDASVLGGTLSITRSNATTQAAGTYTGVLQASGLTSSNYSINYVAGNYTIVRANQLLIRTANAEVTYGSTPTYDTTAQYLDGSNNQIYTLTRTGSAGNYTFDDGVGGSVAVQLKAYNGTSLAGQSSSGRSVVGSYSVKDLQRQVTGNNFVGDPVFVGNLTVNTLGVTPTVSGVSKVYDGGKAMSNLVLGVDGKLTGDLLSLGGVGTYDHKNVGSGLGYQVTGLVLDGADKGNYHIQNGATSLTGNNGVITPASLTAISGRKIYDGQSSLTVGSSGGTLMLRGVNGETASLTAGTVTLSGKDVSATGQSVTAITANGLNTAAGSSLELGNYDLSTVPAAGVNNRIDIDKARLTVLAAEKTYDGQSTVTSSQITRIEGVNGETFTASDGTANIASKNVWVSDNRITSISGLQLAGQNGALTGNYSLDAADLPAAGANTNQVVVQRLALTGVTIDAAGSTYGGTVTPGALNFGASNRIAGDQITASATVVSTGSDLSTSGHLKAGSYLQSTNGTLSGSDAGNYSLASFSTASANYQVGRKAVTVSGITANDKTYNGDAVATLSTSGVNFDGKVSGDILGVASVTGTFADPHVGNGKTVTLSSTTYNGNDRDNYTITDQASTRASITPRALTARLVGTVSKVYDGNTDATLAGNHFVVDGFVTGEGASVSQTVGTYASKNVNDNTGTGQVSASLLPTHLSATGSTRLSNYTLPATASGHVGTITPATLTIKVGDTQAFVTQDARTANHTGFTYRGLEGTDTPTSALVQVPTGSDRSYTGSSNTPALGTYTQVYGLSSTPVAQHGNYTVTVQKGALEVIAADKMLVTISGQNDIYGNRTAGNAGQASSVIAQYCLDASNCNGANLYSLGLSAGSGNGWSGSDNTNTTIRFETTVNTTGQLSTGGFLKAGEHSWGVDNVTASSVNLPFNGVSVNSGTLTIDRLSLTPTADAVSKVYDGTHSAAGVTLGITHEAKTGDDLSATAGRGSYSTQNVVSNGTVTWGNLSLQGNDRDNYKLAVREVLGMGSITPAPLNVALSAQTKTYDGNTSATLASGAITATGVTVNGVTETVTVNQSVGTYNSKNVLEANTVTATLAEGNFSGNNGVDLRNYILPTTVTGSGTITPKALTARLVGTVSKTFDGTTRATLVPSNFSLSGFVGAEGASVGQTVGTYASPNPEDNQGTGRVTASLQPSHFNANAGTLLSNYTLPIAASGNVGTITAPPPTVTLPPVVPVTPPSVPTGNRIDVSPLFGGSGAAVGGAQTVLACLTRPEPQPVLALGGQQVASQSPDSPCECTPAKEGEPEVCHVNAQTVAKRQ